MKRISFLLLLLLIVHSFGYAQAASRIRFNHLDTEDGFSSSSVSSILQDETGIMWFGTQVGLNRYNGYEVQSFENDPFIRHSLSNNLVQTTFLSSDGGIWVGTYGGLNRFDPESGTCTVYRYRDGLKESLSNDVVIAIEEEDSDTMWVGTQDGLNRLDIKTASFQRYFPSSGQEDSLPHKVIRSLLLDRRGQLWIGSYGGLSRYKPETDSFENFAGMLENTLSLESPAVMSIREDPLEDGILWLGLWKGGIVRFDTIRKTMHSYRLPAYSVYTHLIDRSGRIWIGTWGNGLIILDPKSGKTTWYRGSDLHNHEGAFSHDVVYSLFEDASGIIWIGTNGGGIHTYVPWQNRYRFITNKPGDPGTLSQGKVNVINERDDGKLWVGIYSGGLNLLDYQGSLIKRYQYNPRDSGSLSNNIVNDLYRDSSGRFWIATNEGLNIYDPVRDDFQRIYSDGGDRSPADNVVYSIEETLDGRLWFGLNAAGLSVLDPETGRYTHYRHDPLDARSLSDNLVRDVYEDSRGNVWIGTNKGLCRYRPESDDFIRYTYNPLSPDGLNSDNIRMILEDSSARLWIATSGGGLNRYHYSSDSFSSVGRRDGLLGNHILAMIEKDSDQLWLSTNRGISIYDIAKRTVRTIDRSNGLLGGELTRGLFKARDGTVYVGEVNGITVIEEDAPGGEGYIPPLVFSEFLVMGNPVRLGLDSDGTYGELVLDSGEELFSFQVAALDYAEPEQNQYAFRLEGFDGDWIYSGTRNYARYTNLDPGRYRLNVIASGSRGNWNREGLEVPIWVRPPWWQSPAAFIVYLLLFVGLLLWSFFFLRRKQLRAQLYLEREKERNRELDKKVLERTREIETARKMAEEANHAKSLFLANMSHEIRTPLTGLLGMLSLIDDRRLSRQQRSFLNHSKIAADSLNQLVNDLLDIERIESGTLKLYHVPFSLQEAVDNVHHLFLERARKEQIELYEEVNTTACDRVVGDRNRFIQVVTNLVSNAIKYTETGTVHIRLLSSPVNEEGRTSLKLEVEDTGIGIREDQLSSIFEIFTQMDTGYAKSSKGVGLGLAIVKELVELMGGEITVESTPNMGSLFRVSLSQTADGDTLPASFEDVPGDTSLESGEPAPPTAAHLLLCEDEGINRLYLKMILEKAGYSLDIAADGREAVDLGSSVHYDLILMDLGMPEIDGLEASRRIRMAGKDLTPIIALSAHSYEEDIQRCLDVGMDDFVSKPIRERLLLNKIQSWLESGRGGKHDEND